MPFSLHMDHGNLGELRPWEDDTIFGKVLDMLCLIDWRHRNASNREVILRRVLFQT